MASQPTSVPPVLQNFLEAGQTLAQGFFSYLSGQQPSLPGAAPALPVPRPEEVARLQQAGERLERLAQRLRTETAAVVATVMASVANAGQ